MGEKISFQKKEGSKFLKGTLMATNPIAFEKKYIFNWGITEDLFD